MADETPIPTPDSVHDALVEALTAYLVLTTGKPSIRSTDYVLSVAGIDLAEADGRVYYATAYTGPPHARLGLAEILSADVAEGAFPDDET